MFMVVPTWRVTIKGYGVLKDGILRVPESDLQDFLKVLVFNKLEFEVTKEESTLHQTVEDDTPLWTPEASNHAACADCPGCTDPNCSCLDCKGRCAL